MFNTAGAVSTKAKAMYGGRITPEMYDELLRKRSVSELASCLKNETQYRTTLRDIHESTIHRGQLESLLRQDMYHRLGKMARFVDQSYRDYYMVIMKQVEIEQILSRVRVIATQEFTSALAEVPMYLDPYTKVNFSKLVQTHTYEEMLHVLKDTEYYTLLKKFQPKGDETIAYTACETELQRHYMTYVFDMIDRMFKGSTRKTLRKLWATCVELNNITKIYRYKKFFQADEQVIYDSLIVCDGNISKANLKEMLEAPSAEAFMKIVAKSIYPMYNDEKEYVYIEHYADHIRFSLAKKYLHYDTSAPVIFTAYQLLATLEVENLINIIEGVRYNVPHEEIAKMLIY